MKKCLIIRLGEIFLKKKNQGDFVRKLVRNLYRIIKFNYLPLIRIKIRFDHLLIITEELSEKDLTILSNLVNKTFGISNFYSGYLLERNYEELSYFSRKLANFCNLDFDSFKLNIRRVDKSFLPNSRVLSKELGNIIKQSFNLKVDLNNPKRTFYIRIYKEFILFLLKKQKGLGGLPVGSSGKTLLLLSGGIDSPVAAYHLMKRGCQIVYCHFYVKNNGQDKIHKIIKKLSVYNNYQDELYLMDFSNILLEINHISQPKYRLVILKRMFIKLANELAKKIEIKAIATGDSLSQVSSQTIESLKVIYKISDLLIISPLITADKQTIIQEALNLDTYKLSILTYEDCCSLFAPSHPVIKPNLIKVEKIEKELFLDFYSLKNIIYSKIISFNKKISDLETN